MHIRSYSHFWTASVPYSQMNSSMIMKHHWHPSFTAWETIPKGVPTSHIFSQIKKHRQSIQIKKAYSSYAQLEQNLEKIFKEKAYAVVYPELSECVTNIPGADLQVWNHTIDQSFDTKDFVFAVSVDTKFSVADSMADEAENYETYSKLMFPMLAGAIFGSVLWLIGMVWLTVTAGRRPEDEEIHLNGFDRWYTEIAAGTVIGIWLAGTIISGTLIANSSLGYSHVVVTVIVICLICGTYTMAWFLIGYLSLVRRIKAGTLWKNSLIRKVLKWIGKCSGKLADFARAFSRNTAEKNKSSACGRCIFIFAVPDHRLRIQWCRSISAGIDGCRCGCYDFRHQKSGRTGSYYGWSEENKRWRTAV